MTSLFYLHILKSQLRALNDVYKANVKLFTLIAIYSDQLDFSPQIVFGLFLPPQLTSSSADLTILTSVVCYIANGSLYRHLTHYKFLLCHWIFVYESFPLLVQVARELFCKRLSRVLTTKF